MIDENAHPAPDAAATTPSASMTVATPVLDADKYRGHLASLALTREQEDDLLRIVWDMMQAFVDLGFGMDSVSPVAQTASPSPLPSLQLNETNAVRERFRAATGKGKEDTK